MTMPTEKFEGLSPAEIGEINAEMSHYPDKAAVAIEALKIVQKHRRWVSDESIKDIAQLLEVAPDEIDAVATLYNLI